MKVWLLNNGVEVERRTLNYRFQIKYDGQLVIMNVVNQGRHRPMKVVRLFTEQDVAGELQDVHLVWSNDNLTQTPAVDCMGQTAYVKELKSRPTEWYKIGFFAQFDQLM